MDDPVFEWDDGQWFFWNADGYSFGPYGTEDEARAAHSVYAATVLEPE